MGKSAPRSEAGTVAEPPVEYSKLGWFKKLSFGWMNRVVTHGIRNPIDLDTMPLPEDLYTAPASNTFEANWDAAKKEAASGKKPVDLKRVLFRSFGKELMFAGIFKCLWSVFVILGAFFFVRSLLTFVSGKAPYGDAEWKGYVLMAGFFIDAYLLGLALQRMGYGCMCVGVKVRAALVHAVCKKAFSMKSITQSAAADAVSFVASDITKVYDSCQEIHYLWTAPFEAAAILTILATLIGVYALPGWGVIIIVLFLQYFFGWCVIKNKKANAANTNERGGIIQEILPAMKLVKYYAWERFFESRVSEIRKREQHFQFKNAVIKTINIAIVFGTPPMTALVIFSIYEVMVGRLDPTLAFTTLSLFNILRFPLVVLPKALRALSEGLASMSRIQDFMLSEEETVEHVTKNPLPRPGVSITNAKLCHPGKEDFVLDVPEFSVAPGERVAVVGRVGAGKSSLISAILGDMQVVSGEVRTGGSISYVPQNPWCQNLSLRENILFGNEMDEDTYDRVIHDCALELDMQILPKGDLTAAGLRGINLSGGQRQRLNLARAAYFNGDLFLLDNALSAVDHHTAHHIFDNLLVDSLSDKAIILITHQVEFLPKCHKVAIMDEGRVLYFGPWNSTAQSILGRILPVSHMLAASGGAEQVDPEKAKKAALNRQQSNASMSSVKIENKTNAKKKQGQITLGRAIVTYYVYGGLLLGLATFIVFLATQTTRQISDWWIRQWTSDAQQFYSTNSGYATLSGGMAYVAMYGILTALFVGLMVLRGSLFHWWSLGASNNLHRDAITRVLYAPLGFFLQNPVGEILVAFSKEQDIMDENLVDTLHYLGIYGLIMLSTVITVSVTVKLFSVFAGVLIIITFAMLALYLPSATKLKSHRVETGGALVGLVSETLDGLKVIHAFNQTQYFIDNAAERSNRHHKAVYNAESLNLWLAFYCDFYGAIMVLAVSLFAVVLKDELGAAASGLAFSNTIQMLIFYTWSVRMIADAVSYMSSVEKIGWLAEAIPQEGGRLYDPKRNNSVNRGEPETAASSNALDRQSTDTEAAIAVRKTKQATNISPSWPKVGVIQFDNVWMRYAPSAPYALKGVSFRIGHSEKIGVVGRTGSGKSTLLLALYRMFDLDRGHIIIDGLDIATIPLQRLRPSLSIIPQEPVVFSGTVRTNLDPFNEFQDSDLWAVIREVGLEGQVKSSGGMDGKVDGTGGQAWSLGQQQLVCLARAALRKVPVLCLDEATAAMDPHTEAEVTRIAKRLFAERTTFTIAHRLDCVIESDKVIVMEAGVLKEMDAPTTLLDNPNSMFSKLVDKTGEQAAAALRQVAREFIASRQAIAQ